MIRKTLTILSLIGLLLCVGLWGVSYFFYSFKVGIDDFLRIRRWGKPTAVRCCLTLCIAWTLVGTGCTTTMRSLYESVRVGERFSLDDLSVDERRLYWAQRPDGVGRIFWETRPEQHRAWLTSRQERFAVMTDDTGIAIAKYYHLSTERIIIWLLWYAHQDDTLCETDLPRHAKFVEDADLNDPRQLLTETHRLFARTRTNGAVEVLSRLQDSSDVEVDSIYRKVEYEKIFPYVHRNECIMDWGTLDRARLVVQTHKECSLFIRLDMLLLALFPPK